MKVKLIFDLTSSGHLRLTCPNCERALVRQPHMTVEAWLDQAVELIKEHDCQQNKKVEAWLDSAAELTKPSIAVEYLGKGFTAITKKDDTELEKALETIRKIIAEEEEKQ